MARMKFLCDADRCIECNACVTACKNENEVPWGINRRRVVTLNDGKPGERSVSMACMHCSDAPCAAVCPVNCIYTTADAVVLHNKDLCIGCGYCFYACPFGAPQYPKVGNFGSRGKMDKCTYCAGGPEADGSKEEYEKYGANRLAEGKLPLCAEMCSTKALLAGDGEIIAQIYKERVQDARLRLRRLGLADRLSRNRSRADPRRRRGLTPAPPVSTRNWVHRGEDAMAKVFATDPLHRRRARARVHCRNRRAGAGLGAGRPDRRHQRAAAAQAAQGWRHPRRREHSGPEGGQLDPSGRPQLADLPHRHAEVDRRHRHPRHAGAARSSSICGAAP